MKAAIEIFPHLDNAPEAIMSEALPQEVVSPVFAEPVQVILRISEVLGNSEIKEKVEVDHSLVATLSKNPIFKI